MATNIIQSTISHIEAVSTRRNTCHFINKKQILIENEAHKPQSPKESRKNKNKKMGKKYSNISQIPSCKCNNKQERRITYLFLKNQKEERRDSKLQKLLIETHFTGNNHEYIRESYRIEGKTMRIFCSQIDPRKLEICP